MLQIFLLITAGFLIGKIMNFDQYMKKKIKSQLIASSKSIGGSVTLDLVCVKTENKKIITLKVFEFWLEL